MKNFENRDNACLMDFLGKVRKHNKKSQWLGGEVWKGLQEYLANESYKKLCEKSRKIDLVIPRVLDHLFIHAARSLCMSI